MSIDEIRVYVMHLRAGECIRFTREDIELAAPRLRGRLAAFSSGPASWSVPDQVLSNIIGSGKEFGYSTDALTGHVTFWRVPPISDDAWTYLEPDRREGWVKGPDDIWRRYPA